MRLTVVVGSGSARLITGELNSGVGGNYAGDAAGHEQERLAVIFAAHQRDGFALKASYFAIGQNRFQAIADFNAGAVIPDGVENQDSAIGRFAADSPLMEKIDGITFDVGAVQGIDRDESDLRVGFLVDLMADVLNLSRCIGVEDVGEIIDVAGGLEVFDRLGVRGETQGYDQQTNFGAHVHRKLYSSAELGIGCRNAICDKEFATREPGEVEEVLSNLSAWVMLTLKRADGVPI